MSAGRRAGGTASPARDLLARVDALRHERPRAAWRVLTRAFPRAARRASASERGHLWRLRGHVLRSLQRSAPAVAAYRRAQAFFREARDPLEYGRCALGLVDALMYMGRYDEAERAARHGRRALERARDRRALARLLNNQANVYHRMDRMTDALALYRDSRAVLARDPFARALLDVNIANCLSQIGRWSDARRRYESARRSYERQKFPLRALNASYNLAYLDFLEHRHERALTGLARVRSQATDLDMQPLAALASLDRAEIFLRLGAVYDASEEAQDAVRDCERLGLRYERAKAETFAAVAECHLGRPSSSRARLERALGAFNEEGNDVWAGESLVGLATLWHQQGNPRAAEALLCAAVRRFARAKDREREGCALALLACVRIGRGSPRDARTALERASASLRTGSPRLRHFVWSAKAEIARASGDVPRARACLWRAAEEAERLAAQILDEQWRSTFWGVWGWPHRELAALELECGRVDHALEALERGRGRGLLPPLAYRTGGRSERMTDALRGWAATRRSTDRLVRSASVPVRAPQDPALHVALTTRATRQVRAGDIRRSLPPGTILLDYAEHRESLSAIVASRDATAAASHIASTRHVGALVDQVLFRMRSAMLLPAEERGPDRLLTETLTELASVILWPALARADRHEPRAVSIVPIAQLARVPWAALPLPDGRPLCAAMSLSVAPGLRLVLSRPRRVGRGGPLIVAAPGGELARVEEETAAIHALFPHATLLTGADASAERFLALAPEAEWIHFAGHGLYLADSPFESGLQLADRLLSAEEIMHHPLAASWMALSACQGARALVRPGEEWYGLARAVLQCGARSVLASQWDVEDWAAARLMRSVYEGIAQGSTIETAVAETQRDLSRSGAHPIEWAGFVVLGASAPGPQVVATGTTPL